MVEAQHGGIYAVDAGKVFHAGGSRPGTWPAQAATFRAAPTSPLGLRSFRENASRGPWGSLRLLYYINWKALAGSAGAVITILALAMDPFAQQVISFDSRQAMADNMTIIIHAARAYDMNSQWEMSTDTSCQQGYNKIKDTKINGATYQAVFGPTTTRPCRLTVRRATALGMGAIQEPRNLQPCMDVTTATNTTRVCEGGPHTPWDETKLLNRTCQYETPSGYQIGGNAVNWHYMRDYEQYHTLWNSTTYWDDFRIGEYESPPDQGLATVAALKSVDLDDTNVTGPEIWLESAHECTLSWCAMEYGSTNAKNGQLSDEPTPLTFVNRVPCHNESIDYVQSMGSYAWSTTGIFITKYLVPGFEPDEMPETPICYTANGAAYEHFSTDPNAFWLNTQDDVNLQIALGSMLTTTFESIARPGDDKARALFRAASFPDTMDQVARSMTIQIRTGPNQTQIHGSVHINDHLVLFSAVFLVTSMTLATRDCNGWKSSVLPGFYHGLSGWEAKELHTRDTEDMTEDMERSAKGMWVTLRDDEDGSAKLMRADKSSDR